MQELQRLDRSRRRWRAIAIALALGHVLILVSLGTLHYKNQLDRRRERVGQLVEELTKQQQGGPSLPPTQQSP